MSLALFCSAVRQWTSRALPIGTLRSHWTARCEASLFVSLRFATSFAVRLVLRVDWMIRSSPPPDSWASLVAIRLGSETLRSTKAACSRFFELTIRKMVEKVSKNGGRVRYTSCPQMKLFHVRHHEFESYKYEWRFPESYPLSMLLKS